MKWGEYMAREQATKEELNKLSKSQLIQVVLHYRRLQQSKVKKVIKEPELTDELMEHIDNIKKIWKNLKTLAPGGVRIYYSCNKLLKPSDPVNIDAMYYVNKWHCQVEYIRPDRESGYWLLKPDKYSR